MTEQPRILRLKDLKKRLGLSESAIYNFMRPWHKRYDPTFPKQARLGGTASVGWLESEIEEWAAKNLHQLNIPEQKDKK